MSKGAEFRLEDRFPFEHRSAANHSLPGRLLLCLPGSLRRGGSRTEVRMKPISGGLASLDERVGRHVKGQQPCLSASLPVGEDPQANPAPMASVDLQSAGAILEDGRCSTVDGKC